MQQPLPEVGIGVGQVPAVVADAGVFDVGDSTASGLDGLDHTADGVHGIDHIGVTLKAPTGDIFQLGDCRLSLTGAHRDDGRPAVGMGGCEAPGAFTTHRVAREGDPVSIHPVRLLDFIKDGQSPDSIRSLGFPTPPLVLGGRP